MTILDRIVKQIPDVFMPPKNEPILTADFRTLIKLNLEMTPANNNEIISMIVRDAIDAGIDDPEFWQMVREKTREI